MSKLYVGIDQSYSALAIAFNLPSNNSHEVIRKAFPAAKYGSGVDRLLAIERWIAEEIALRYGGYYIGHICMEGYSYASKNGREIAGELAYAVKRVIWCAQNAPVGYPTIVAPNLLKKFVTGSGSASKAEMLLWVYKRWGVSTKNDNDADAYGLARIAEALDMEHHGDLPVFQQEVIAKLTRHTEMPKAA